jgi:Ser/Thr protein kinase RdoA (MazF antagonist)
MYDEIFSAYGINRNAAVQPFGNGLINSTWKISDGAQEFILQKINKKVFRVPEAIASNIEKIAAFLKELHPEYFFVTPVLTESNDSMVRKNGDYYRLFPFVKSSTSYNVTETPEQAFEAARQFGMFTKMLSTFDVKTLKITLPDFHNLTLRFAQFEEACTHGNVNRIKESKREINFLEGQSNIVATYNEISRSSRFQLRVTHHDTKISNVLFNEQEKGLCVIDLDTVMPGYFISDIGDMIRTYLSPVSEEENDLSKVEIREDFFRGIVHGYLKEMISELSNEEMEHFVYAGKFLIYMQALRFLTDHFNNDMYYGAAYENQNLMRAKNQIMLLKRLMEKENELLELVMQQQLLKNKE